MKIKFKIENDYDRSTFSKKGGNEMIKGAIYGLAVGDALGVPYEFKARDTFKCVDMVGYGTYGKPAGTWSDDTSMVLATCDSLRRCGGVDCEDMMSRFADWYFNGAYTARGDTFDVGITTQTAIVRYKRGIPATACGLDNNMAQGNGGLMRILPLAFIDCTDEEIMDVCGLTHAHRTPKALCVEYIRIARRLIKGESIPDVLAAWRVSCPRDSIKSTGYVVDTMEAALWCLANTTNYKDCVLTAVNLGNDTDTVAAVAGGLAGIVYGFDSIPKEWVEKLANKQLIDECIGGMGN